MVETSRLPEPPLGLSKTLAAGWGSCRLPDQPLGERAGQRPPALHHVLELRRVFGRAVVRRLVDVEGAVGDHVREVQPVAELVEQLLRHLLDLVGGVAGLDLGAERPALDGLGQDGGGRADVLGGGPVGGVELVVVVAAAGQGAQLVVGEVLDHLAQAGVGAEEVVADVGAALDRVLLELAVEGGVHLVEQDAVDVAGQQLVPLRAPDDLDDVPARAPEHRLQLLDDLAVAPDRAVEALQVAVHDEGQVVEVLPGRDRQGAEGLGLVALAVAHEGPHPRPAGVGDAAVHEVAVEPGLVDGVDRPEAHGDGGELPEVRHEPGVGVRREPAMLVASGAGPARPDLLAEVVELLLGQAALEEGPGVDAGGGVALEVDLVAGLAVVLAPEEVVEADLVERRRAGVGGQVAADPGRLGVGPGDHHRRVPPDVGPDAALHVLVAGEPRLPLGRDGVDVVRRDHRREADLQLPGPLEHLQHQEAGAGLPPRAGYRVERVDPLGGLLGVDVGELLGQAVEDHRSIFPFLGPWRVTSLFRVVAHRLVDHLRLLLVLRLGTEVAGAGRVFDLGSAASSNSPSARTR